MTTAYETEAGRRAVKAIAELLGELPLAQRVDVVEEAFGGSLDPSWSEPDLWGGRSCYVEQGFYGHAARKPTWLYAVSRSPLPELRWGLGEQRIPPENIERWGYEKARRYGVVSLVGGKRKKEIRNATPPEFRDLLLAIARDAAPLRRAA